VGLSSLLRQAEAVLEVPRDLLLRRYPAFVTGGDLPRGQVPVFVFHSLEPESFGRKLQYLADNEYVTLSATEYFHFLLGMRPVPSRAVVLTFDDGRGSLWTIGLPFLRRHGMKGVVFLVPGRTPSRPGPLPPSWDDVTTRRDEPQVLSEREAGDGAFLSWEEVEAMARSGHFEFHSHTLTHGRVHTHPRVAGFVTPESQKGYAAMDVPLIRENGGDRLAPDVPLGTPLLQSESRTSDALRFVEDPAIRRACVEAVAAEGGAAFFARRGWESRLRRLLPSAVTGRVETPGERDAALRRELAESKRQIEEHTGQEAPHLCWPWHVSGEASRRLAREAGYRTAFVGKVPGTPITPSGGDPHAIARIGEDYVELLPGRGRADLVSVLRKKWRRRLRGRA
jgi:peptidoglycan/xylan/chitin deacetylase (PgdA/CDA1 family)